MFSWDSSKAVVNQLKHKVSFKEATSVFADLQALEGPDVKHSQLEVIDEVRSIFESISDKIIVKNSKEFFDKNYAG